MDKEIKDKIKELRSIKLAECYLSELKLKEFEYKKRKIELEKLLDKKLKEINKLSKNTLLSNYMKILGKRESVLEISKEYYFKLIIEYNEVVELIDKVGFEKNILFNKIKKLETVKSDLREEIAIRDKRLKSPKLKKLKKIIISIDNKLELATEIEEAILAGEDINKRFNQALKYISQKSESVKRDMQNDKWSDRSLFSFDIRKIERYQNHVINIRHSMLKFESEVNDIYKFMFNDSSRKYSIGDNFLREHRNKLFKDLRKEKELVKCNEFLKNQKNVILNFTKTLINDLKKLNKEIDELEIFEEKLINEL